MTILEDIDRAAYNEARRYAEGHDLDATEFGRMVEMTQHAHRLRAFREAAEPYLREVSMLLDMNSAGRYMLLGERLVVRPPEDYLTGSALEYWKTLQGVLLGLRVTYGLVEAEGPPAPSPSVVTLPPRPPR